MIRGLGTVNNISSSVAWGANSLTASATGISIANYEEVQSLILARQPWQRRAWLYYDDVGPIHYAANFVGNAISRINLIAAEMSDVPTDDPVATNNQVVIDAVASLKNDRKNQSGLLKQLAINLFLVGEAYVVGYTRDGKQQWEVYSTDQVQLYSNNSSIQVRDIPGAPLRNIPDGAFWARIWAEHPRYYLYADSAVRATLEDCDDILTLGRADKAVSKSRYAGAGLLYFPTEIVGPGTTGASADGGPTTGETNPLYDTLIQTMIAPLKDEGDPSSVVPGVIFGPAEYADKIRHITFDRSHSDKSEIKKQEAIRRIAVSLDLPPEVLTGHGDTNHWSAWQIREETFQQHLQPFIEMIVDGLTVAYLQQALINAGVEDPEKYLIWYDASSLIARPDKSQQAVSLHERLVISDQALRQANGFNEEDSPDDEEYERRAALQLRVPGPVLGEEYDQQGNGGGPSNVPPSKIPTRDDDGNNRRGPSNLPGPAKSDSTVNHNSPLGVDSDSNIESKKGSTVSRSLVSLDMDLVTYITESIDSALSNAINNLGSSRSTLTASSTITLGVVEDDALDTVLDEALEDIDSKIEEAQDQSLLLLAAILGVAVESLRGEYLDSFIDARSVAVSELRKDTKEVFTSRVLNDDGSPRRVRSGDALSSKPASSRRAVSIAGGTPADIASVSSSGGIGTGPISDGIMTDAGVLIEGYIWHYGFSKDPFKNHKLLDGMFYATDNDDVLIIKSGDDWIGTHYRIGDHRGCNCFAERVYRLADDQS